jgi:polyhydroxyalkanoate synthesis repressor PhaR
MQTIKKYANRKLYHTNRKQYITLEGIAALIQAGEQVQVLNNETGEDITTPVLSQVVVQSRGRSRLPMHVLTGLIQAGGDTLTGVRRTLLTTLGGNAAVDAEIKRRLDRLHEAGALSAAELDRLRQLLLPAEADTSASAELAVLPSRSDLARLNAQVDALAAAVEQLLAERTQRDHDGDVSP